MKRSCDASYVLASSRLKEVPIWTDHIVSHVDRSCDHFTLSLRCCLLLETVGESGQVGGSCDYFTNVFQVLLPSRNCRLVEGSRKWACGQII